MWWRVMYRKHDIISNYDRHLGTVPHKASNQNLIDETLNHDRTEWSHPYLISIEHTNFIQACLQE